MKTLLFGVSNVGKTAVGKALAEETGYPFFDLDEVIKEKFGSVTAFQSQYRDQRKRDAIRLKLVKELIAVHDNCIVAMSPIAYITGYNSLFTAKDIRCFELYDKAENIFERLVFTDAEGNVIDVPKTYLEKHKQHYLREIKEDLNYFHSVYKGHMEMIHVNGMSVSEVVAEMLPMIDE